MNLSWKKPIGPYFLFPSKRHPEARSITTINELSGGIKEFEFIDPETKEKFNATRIDILVFPVEYIPRILCHLCNGMDQHAMRDYLIKKYNLKETDEMAFYEFKLKA